MCCKPKSWYFDIQKFLKLRFNDYSSSSQKELVINYFIRKDSQLFPLKRYRNLEMNLKYRCLKVISN